MTKLRTLALALLASAGFAGAASAADFSEPYTPYTPTYSAFNFEGFYIGVTGGGIWDGTSAYLVAPDTAAFSVGGVAGVNFFLTDTVLGGLEVQGSVDVGTSGTVFDGFLLGRLGFAPSDNVMVYAAGGPGIAGGTGVYGIGGGVEFAATDSMSVRGELLGIGTWGAAPDAAKATVGLLWHMQ
ncbi:MAG: hypothetical protein KDJ19_05295 [Hyphomicrobiaceae bacterium]|nr:hypothetical protein [Hyphomicrobiaceae bacterium]MCC0023513.1 hypothetical protein [Hyphomicrobiaceae bacterium]